MSFIPPPPNRPDIDFGTVPSRTTKSITMQVKEEVLVQDKPMGGTIQKYTSAIDVHIYVRDVSMRGLKREPQELIDLEKYVIEYIALNRKGFIDEGITDVNVVGVRSYIDDAYKKQGIWYHTVVTLEAIYYLTVSA